MQRILVYTVLALAIISTYVVLNSYYTQLAIHEEKELFKLDCIAKAVAFNISGSEHTSLVSQYPASEFGLSAYQDARYQKIKMQLAMAKEMTQLPSEMFTVIKDTASSDYLMAVSTDRNAWLNEYPFAKGQLDSLYVKGGMLGRYTSHDGERLAALSTVLDGQGKVVGVLHVEETFETFIAKAREQIYWNIALSLFFVLLIGTLMIVSVRSILKRQNALAREKQELATMRQQLVANVSHDLRTPLASIHGYLETLVMKNEELTAAQRNDFLLTSLQSTGRMKAMVDEFFELSQLESGEIKLLLEEFPLMDLIYDVVAEQKLVADGKGIELLVESESQLPLVKSDMRLMNKIAQNTIGNAVKYGRSQTQVRITVKRESTKLWVSVRDSGPGISKSDLPFVFDRFRRGNTAESGTGLGLAIVKSALDVLEEKYTLESEEGVGTTFRFSIEIATAQA
jgi:signal transduction histidine kinase